MAADLSSMMELTVSKGTARRAFRFRGARALDAAGKTGSIASKNPYHDYSWFVGFAPASAPRIAVAALVVNGPKWRIHASALAAAALRTYLHPQPGAVRSASSSGAVRAASSSGAVRAASSSGAVRAAQQPGVPAGVGRRPSRPWRKPAPSYY